MKTIDTMMVFDPFNECEQPVAAVLRGLAIRQGCDGPPWDQMMAAANYIDLMEDRLSEVEHLVMLARELVWSVDTFGPYETPWITLVDKARLSLAKFDKPPDEPLEEVVRIAPPADGWYFYREGPGRWWRATRIDGNSVTAPWIDGTAKFDRTHGEWVGPLANADPELGRALTDPMGRLRPNLHPKTPDFYTRYQKQVTAPPPGQ